jgi:hypothetical protein
MVLVARRHMWRKWLACNAGAPAAAARCLLQLHVGCALGDQNCGCPCSVGHGVLNSAAALVWGVARTGREHACAPHCRVRASIIMRPGSLKRYSQRAFPPRACFIPCACVRALILSACIHSTSRQALAAYAAFPDVGLLMQLLMQLT